MPQLKYLHNGPAKVGIEGGEFFHEFMQGESCTIPESLAGEIRRVRASWERKGFILIEDEPKP